MWVCEEGHEWQGIIVQTVTPMADNVVSIVPPTRPEATTDLYDSSDR